VSQQRLIKIILTALVSPVPAFFDVSEEMTGETVYVFISFISVIM
jgi:hypothetical protein